LTLENGSQYCIRMSVTNQPTLHNNPKEQRSYPRKSFQNVKIHLQDADALQKTYVLISA